MYFSLDYDEPLFRPPSEGRSCIFQVTLGCSWNKCAFCEMYTSKSFSVRPEKEVFNEIEQMASIYPGIERVFLADGNAMVLKTNKLLRILGKLKSSFLRLRRVTSYALPSDLVRKSDQELKTLREAGLSMVYVGIETGDDELLERIGKGETYDSSLKGCLKARRSGMKLSAMILNGLGGSIYSSQHAINSAKLVNEIQPEFLSTLVLSFPYGVDHFRTRFQGNYEQLSTLELIEEMGIFISHLELEHSVFRSDHASNYLVLKGTLNRDKEKLLGQIQQAINHPRTVHLREEWQRGL